MSYITNVLSQTIAWSTKLEQNWRNEGFAMRKTLWVLQSVKLVRGSLLFLSPVRKDAYRILYGELWISNAFGLLRFCASLTNCYNWLTPMVRLSTIMFSQSSNQSPFKWITYHNCTMLWSAKNTFTVWLVLKVIFVKLE